MQLDRIDSFICLSFHMQVGVLNSQVMAVTTTTSLATQQILVLTALSLILASSPLTVSARELDRHIVPCGTQQKVCECRETADECEFTLLIEELQTFVSYEVETADPGFAPASNPGLRNVLRREEEGKPFYINDNGVIVPSFELRDDDDDSDCITYTEDFEGAECTVPITVDGRTYRPCIAVNGQVPGPTLIVYEDQFVVANVINGMLTETMSIHWHGMNQRNTPWMDGALHVSQCPISPGESFRYYFKADPSGTFWYHSHRVTQRADGLFGALIVRESAETRNRLQDTLGMPVILDNPATQTLNLHEWDIVPNLDTYTITKGGVPFFPDKPLGEIPLPITEQMEYEPFEETFGPDGLTVGDAPFFSGLINGKGRNRDVPFQRTRLEVFNVDDDGGVYRFRLIGAQSQFAYKFSIDEHILTVISTDGQLIEPVDTNFIILHTGERYDFLLRATRPREDVDDYWIRAETLEVDKTRGLPYPSIGNLAEAILHYGPAPPPSSPQYEEIKNRSMPFDPARCGEIGGCTAVNCPFESFHTSFNICRCINAHQLRLLWPTPPDQLPSANVDPECEDCELFFNVGSDTDSINGRNMQLPPFPLQTQYEMIPPTDFCDVTAPCESEDGEACSCVHVRQINSFNKTIRFVLSSVGDEVDEGEGSTHPMHLHGHHFYVLDIGYGTYHPENQTLRRRNTDIDCGDAHCSIPRWRSGQRPDFNIDSKTVRKDTIIVPGGGYVVLQFVSDNPGFWFLHCHIIPDLLEGMAVVINEVPSRQNPAPPGVPTCGGFSITPDQFYERFSFDPDAKMNSAGRNCLSVATFLLSLLLAMMTLPA